MMKRDIQLALFGAKDFDLSIGDFIELKDGNRGRVLSCTANGYNISISGKSKTKEIDSSEIKNIIEKAADLVKARLDFFQSSSDKNLYIKELHKVWMGDEYYDVIEHWYYAGVLLEKKPDGKYYIAPYMEENQGRYDDGMERDFSDYAYEYYCYLIKRKVQRFGVELGYKPEEKKTTKTAKQTKRELDAKELKPFISKDPSRPVLATINYDEEGYMVATDSFVLAAIKSNFPKSLVGKNYVPANLANSALLKSGLAKQYEDGFEIDSKFPNWRSVVPTGGKKQTIDLNKVELLCNKALIAAEVLDLCTDYVKESFRVVVNWGENNISLSPERLKNVITLAKKIDAKKIRVVDLTHAITFNADDDSLLLLMPMMPDPTIPALYENGLYLASIKSIKEIYNSLQSKIDTEKEQMKWDIRNYKKHDSAIKKYSKLLSDFKAADFKKIVP